MVALNHTSATQTLQQSQGVDQSKPRGGGKDCKNASEDNQNATNGPPDEEHLSPGVRLELSSRRSSRVSQKPDRYTTDTKIEVL